MGGRAYPITQVVMEEEDLNRRVMVPIGDYARGDGQ